MGQEAREKVVEAEFSGLARTVNPYRLPPGGSQIQINCTSEGIDRLDVRAGYREVSFEDD